MTSPTTRTRTNSTTPILQKHRSTTAHERPPDVRIMVEDDQHEERTELRDMGATSKLSRAHTASQNGAGMRYDPTLDRKLVSSRRKLELATFRLNQVHAAGGNTAQLTTNLNKVIGELSEFIAIADPAQLLEEVMTPATRQARADYARELTEFETAVKAGRAKHGWNLVAGGVGNAICFGVGGLIGTWAGNPLVGLPINTFLWTFTEPLISMMRATTVTNPYLDLYMVRQRLQARAAREALDGTAGLERNRKFAWVDPDTKKTTWLNAADWLSRSNWANLWGGKYLTDDLPCYLYSVTYSIANCLPEFTSADIYGNLAGGKWTRAATRTVAGMIAGAALQECVQLLRAGRAHATGGKEIVTRTTALWRKEAAVVRKVLQDIESRQQDAGISPQQKQAYAVLHRSFTLWHRKAVAKSSILSAIRYEWGAMMQSKREAIGIDPEVPGKGLYTAASFIGKGLAQLPGQGTSQLAASAVKSTVPWLRWLGYLTPPLAMIGAGGFILRRELEVAAHTMLGAAHGIARRCCGGHEAQD
jgi:hypothetical protein